MIVLLASVAASGPLIMLSISRDEFEDIGEPDVVALESPVGTPCGELCFFPAVGPYFRLAPTVSTLVFGVDSIMRTTRFAGDVEEDSARPDGGLCAELWGGLSLSSKLS